LVEGVNQLIRKSQDHLRKPIGETDIISDIKLWTIMTEAILKHSTHKIKRGVLGNHLIMEYFYCMHMLL
jgi:hypothetical protein